MNLLFALLAQVPEAVPAPTSLKEMLYGVLGLGGVMVARELTWWAGKAKDAIGKKNGAGHGYLAEAIRDLASNAKSQTALLERLVDRQDQDHDLLVKIKEGQK